MCTFDATYCLISDLASRRARIERVERLPVHVLEQAHARDSGVCRAISGRRCVGEHRWHGDVDRAIFTIAAGDAGADA